MKIILKIINSIMAFCVGSFVGLLITGIFTLFLIKSGALTKLSNTGIEIMFYLPAIILGLLGVIAEVIKTNSKIIVWFQNNILRKIYIVISIVCIIALSIFMKSKINDLLYGKYNDFADSIIKTIGSDENTDDNYLELKFNNEQNIDYIMICRGYDVDKEGISRTGLLDEEIITKINNKNPKEDGLYMHLLKNNEIVSVKSLQGIYYMDGSFQLAKVKDSFNINIRKNKNGKYSIVGIK